MTEETEGGAFAQWIKNNVTPLITMATFTSVLFGGFFWIEGRYAKADQVSQLERRLDIKVKSDFLQQTQSRIWQLEDRLKAQPNDTTATEDLRKLNVEKEELERDLNRLKEAAPR